MNSIQTNSPNNCVICYDEINTTDLNTIKTKCRHVFHKTCLDNWIIQNDTCPTCRQPDPKNRLADFYQNARSGIQSLQQITISLSNNLENTSRLIEELETRSIKCIFPISFHGNEHNIVGTIFFHLYRIHLNESPRRLRDDIDYGRKAFLNINDFNAENSERMRSLQRVIIEVALQALSKAIEKRSDPEIREFLDILESIQVHEKDRPYGNENIAHLIYRNIYRSYLLRQESNPNLIHPHNSIFRNDFGRVVMRNEVASPPSLDKMAIINDLQYSLNQAWKLSSQPQPQNPPRSQPQPQNHPSVIGHITGVVIPIVTADELERIERSIRTQVNTRLVPQTAPVPSLSLSPIQPFHLVPQNTPLPQNRDIGAQVTTPFNPRLAIPTNQTFHPEPGNTPFPQNNTRSTGQESHTSMN